jgi:hypothetical protein
MTIVHMLKGRLAKIKPASTNELKFSPNTTNILPLSSKFPVTQLGIFLKTLLKRFILRIGFGFILPTIY